jgi:hypothetical protein
MSLCSRTRVLAAFIVTTTLLTPNPSLAQRPADRDVPVRRASAAAPLSPVALVSRLWSLLTSLWQANQAGPPSGKPGPVPGQAGPDDGSVGGGDNGSSLDPNGHGHN